MKKRRIVPLASLAVIVLGPALFSQAQELPDGWNHAVCVEYCGSPSDGSSSARHDSSSNSSGGDDSYSPPKANPKQDSIELLQDGMEMEKKLQWKGGSAPYEYEYAFNSFVNALSKNKKNCAAMIGEAQVLTDAGRYEDSLRFFEQAKKCGHLKQTKRYWDNADEIDHIIDKIRVKLGDGSILPCHQWNCRDVWTDQLWTKGNDAFHARRYADAEVAFRQVTDYKGDYPNVYRRLGDTLIFEQKFNEALKAYNETLFLADDHSRAGMFAYIEEFLPQVRGLAYNETARDLLAKGNVHDAEEMVSKATEACCDIGGKIVPMIEVRETQTDIFIATKDWDHARWMLENDLERDMNYPGGIDNAMREVYDGIYKNHSSLMDPSSNVLNGMKANSAKDWNAAQFYWLSYALTPEGAKDINSYRNLAFAFQQAGYPANAKFVLTQALKVFPNNNDLQQEANSIDCGLHGCGDSSKPLPRDDNYLSKEPIVRKDVKLEDNINKILSQGCAQGFDGAGKCKP